MQTMTPAIRVSDEVRTAIDAGAPVLALESTILSHGLPAPRNLEVGLTTERQVLDA
jgi:pseudouridylate synthase